MIDQPKIYIAGPMRGIKDFNFPAFHEAAAYYRRLGYFVFSPAERDEEKYGAENLKSETGDLKDLKNFDQRDAMKGDLTWICDNATHIHMLHGWEQSSGAFAEWALARCLIGVTILYE